MTRERAIKREGLAISIMDFDVADLRLDIGLLKWVMNGRIWPVIARDAKGSQFGVTTGVGLENFGAGQLF